VTAHRCAGDGIAVPCSPPWQGSEAASLAAGHPAFDACLPACSNKLLQGNEQKLIAVVFRAQSSSPVLR